MNFDFAKSMQELPDEELVRITTLDRDDYQEAALIAAEKELANRHLSSEQISSATKFNQEQKKIAESKANEPLDIHWKILSVFFPGILQLIISGILIGNGYNKKAKELTKWTFLGITFYIVLIIITK